MLPLFFEMTDSLTVENLFSVAIFEIFRLFCFNSFFLDKFLMIIIILLLFLVIVIIALICEIQWN